MLIIFCWKLFTTKTSEIFVLAGEQRVTAKRVIYLCLKKKKKIKPKLNTLKKVWVFQIRWTKRHLEFVFFSGPSPLIAPDLILAEVTCLSLYLLLCCHLNYGPLMVYINPVAVVSFEVALIYTSTRGCAWGVQLPLCQEHSLQRFQYHVAHMLCSKFCPSCIAQLLSYQLVTWFRNYKVLLGPRNLLFQLVFCMKYMISFSSILLNSALTGKCLDSCFLLRHILFLRIFVFLMKKEIWLQNIWCLSPLFHCFPEHAVCTWGKKQHLCWDPAWLNVLQICRAN